MKSVVLWRIEPGIEPRERTDGLRVTPKLRHGVQLDQEEHLEGIEPDEDEREVEQVLDAGFHPAEANRGEERHLFARVVGRMDGPPELGHVQQAMMPVVDEVDEHVAHDAGEDRSLEVKDGVTARPGSDGESKTERGAAEGELDHPHPHVHRHARGGRPCAAPPPAHEELADHGDVEDPEERVPKGPERVRGEPAPLHHGIYRQCPHTPTIKMKSAKSMTIGTPIAIPAAIRNPMTSLEGPWFGSDGGGGSGCL
jgi:hypothetical protein